MTDRYITFIVSLFLIIVAICFAIAVTDSGWWLLIFLFIDLDIKDFDGEKEEDD